MSFLIFVCTGAILALVWPQAVTAHGDHLAAPEAHLWTLDPWVIIPFLVVVLAYGRGLYVLWRRAGIGHGVRRWQVGCFVSGMTALFLALIWPLDKLSAYSFAVHMGQHMVLLVVAPPLLILGSPLPVLMLALPPSWRRRFISGWRNFAYSMWQSFTRPIMASVIHGMTIWIWHAPGAFEAALNNDALHIVEHATFLGTALLFWWTLVHSGRSGAAGYGGGALWALTALLHTGLLGALITFSRRPLYPSHGDHEGIWDLTPLEDQQLAGLIMWVPMGLIYLIAGLVLIAAWLNNAERRSYSN